MASRGVNKVILVGNVGQDPESRYMPNGNAVTNISLATSESWKDRNTGQQQEKTEWHRLVFYSKLAEIVNEYVKKGSKLYVEGRLQTRSWEQDGVKRYATDIIVNDMQMLDGRSGAGSGDNWNQDQAYSAPSQQPAQSRPQSQPQSQPQSRPSSPPPADDGGMYDDDIPF